jgi:hypothetical protein
MEATWSLAGNSSIPILLVLVLVLVLENPGESEDENEDDDEDEPKTRVSGQTPPMNRLFGVPALAGPSRLKTEHRTHCRHAGSWPQCAPDFWD